MITGNDFLNRARLHIGEKYVFGAVAPLQNTDYKGPWDCVEFASWVTYQVTGKIIGVRNNNAYTGHWKTDAAVYCTKISIEDAVKTAGAILFRSPGYSNIGIGHIAFSDGQGGTVEAKSRNEGVTAATANSRTWEMGLLIKGVDYSQNNFLFDYANPPYNFKVKNPLMSNKIVREAKIALVKKGIFYGEINEMYDLEMSKAVSNYQKMQGLGVDGVMGKETIKSLLLRSYTSLEKALIWFKENIGPATQSKLSDTPFDIDLLAAIAYQETGYIWGRMINKIPLAEILKNCVGDTLDSPNRSAFPKTKAELESKTKGAEMFKIARESLGRLRDWDSTFKRIYDTMPNKFCHGYGIFQYDLQFFLSNPNYFLNKEWENLDNCIDKVLSELRAAQNRIAAYRGKTVLTFNEKIYVAIAYNKGTANINSNFKQGHRNSDSGKYYGELIHEYYALSKTL